MRAEEFDAQLGFAAGQVQPGGAVFGPGSQPVRNELPGKPGPHEFTGRVVGVVHHGPGVVFGKQAALGGFVVGQVRVLAGADVIRREVGEGNRLKGQPVHPVAAQGLAAHLQHAVAHPGVPHGPQQPVQLQAFRRGVGGGLVPAGKVGPVGADVSAGQARPVEDGRGEQRRGGFALCAGDADQVHLIRRMAVKGSAHQGQGAPAVRHQHLGGVRRKIQRALSQKRPAAGLIGGGGVVVAVRLLTGQADEQRARPGLAGVVDNGGDFGIEGGAFVGHTGQKCV